MVHKNLAIRILEKKKIHHSVLSYDPVFRNAEAVAEAVGLPPESVFKTLVVTRPQGKPILVMLPANMQLDLKKVAKALGEKKVKMASHREAEALTGLQVGGISPLAVLNRGFTVVLDDSATDLQEICISAGARGLQIKLGPRDFMKVSKARLVRLSS